MNAITAGTGNHSKVDGKKLVGSLQSARMRHLQNQPHSFITSNEQIVDGASRETPVVMPLGEVKNTRKSNDRKKRSVAGIQGLNKVSFSKHS